MERQVSLVDALLTFLLLLALHYNKESGCLNGIESRSSTFASTASMTAGRCARTDIEAAAVKKKKKICRRWHLKIEGQKNERAIIADEAGLLLMGFNASITTAKELISPERGERVERERKESRKSLLYTSAPRESLTWCQLLSLKTSSM